MLISTYFEVELYQVLIVYLMARSMSYTLLQLLKFTHHQLIDEKRHGVHRESPQEGRSSTTHEHTHALAPVRAECTINHALVGCIRK